MRDQFHRRRPGVGDRAETKEGQVCEVISVIENIATFQFEAGGLGRCNVGLLTWLPSEASMKADRVREMEKQLAAKRASLGAQDARDGSPHTSPAPWSAEMQWNWDGVGE